MIKFFRKIRQQLLSEKKFSKYALYAISEILLVVVGILIALAIDNWNEGRKTDKEEIKMLQNFRVSVAGNLQSIRWHGKEFEDTDKSINTLLLHISQDLPYHDSLKFHFSKTTNLWSPSLNQEVFSTLTSTDLNIISNDSLKNEIIAYYSFAKRNFDVRINRYTDLLEDASRNIFNTRFNALWNNTWKDPHKAPGAEWMVPNDYETLKKDREYIYFLRSLKNQLYWYVHDPLQQAEQKTKNLIKALDQEIKELD